MIIDVRKIDPDFLFGFYPYSPFWYYDGLIRGAGSDELPCLLFPTAAGRWDTVNWKLTPENTRYEAAILDPKDNHQLRSRLYNGDSLASLNAIVEQKPLLLQLQVFPTKEEPVILEQVKIGFMPIER